MVSKDDLRNTVILGYLSERMREKVLPIVEVMTFLKNDVVFKEGDAADRFFILKRGKVLLEKRISENITVSMGAVSAGFCFGWSFVLDGEVYTSDAICADSCEIFSVKREKLLNLFNQDNAMGYLFMQRLLSVVKKRLDYRTVQFLRAIENHPDTKTLF